MTVTEQLKAPFPAAAISWRVGATNAKKLKCKPWEATKGIGLAYIDARDVMQRLDEVCGDLYQVEYPFEGCCRIGIKIGDEWIWRSNGAGVTDVEAEKGQYSDAFKRAAVLWGVGRYLYDLPNVWFDLENGKIKGTPTLPAWAKPSAYANPDDLEKIRILMNQTNTNELQFCKALKCNNLSELPKEKTELAMSKLREKQAKSKETN